MGLRNFKLISVMEGLFSILLVLCQVLNPGVTVVLNVLKQSVSVKVS